MWTARPPLPARRRRPSSRAAPPGVTRVRWAPANLRAGPAARCRASPASAASSLCATAAQPRTRRPTPARAPLGTPPGIGVQASGVTTSPRSQLEQHRFFNYAIPARRHQHLGALMQRVRQTSHPRPAPSPRRNPRTQPDGINGWTAYSSAKQCWAVSRNQATPNGPKPTDEQTFDCDWFNQIGQYWLPPTTPKRRLRPVPQAARRRTWPAPPRSRSTATDPAPACRSSPARPPRPR